MSSLSRCLQGESLLMKCPTKMREIPTKWYVRQMTQGASCSGGDRIKPNRIKVRSAL